MKKRTAFAGIVLLGLTAGVVILGGPVLKIRGKRDRKLCQRHLLMLSLGIKQYTRDYDELMPLKNEFHLALMPYLKADHVFHCSLPGYGYRYNRNLGGMNESLILEPVSMAMFYDAEGSYQSDAGESWLLDGVHIGGNNVLYFDGHTKWKRDKPPFWTPEMKEMRVLQALYDEKDGFWRKARTAKNLARKQRLEVEIQRKRDEFRAKYGRG